MYTKRAKENPTKPDIPEKILADYNDVFADIVNVLLFNGKKVVCEEDLESAKDKSQYKADNKIHEQERDVAKILKKLHIRIAFIGFEHQMKPDPYEPIRVIGYDGASYRGQLLARNGQIYPVVTLVLYFGSKRWDKATSLYELLKIPEEWKQYVNDYKINLFEIAFLSQEQINMFTSDFRIVADYFVQRRVNKDYIPTREIVQHVDAVLKLMSVLTGDTRFEDAQNAYTEGGVTSMGERFLDQAEARGETRGEIKAYVKLGWDINKIVAETKIPQKEVESIIDSLKKKGN